MGIILNKIVIFNINYYILKIAYFIYLKIEKHCDIL